MTAKGGYVIDVTSPYLPFAIFETAISTKSLSGDHTSSELEGNVDWSIVDISKLPKLNPVLKNGVVVGYTGAFNIGDYIAL